MICTAHDMKKKRKKEKEKKKEKKKKKRFHSTEMRECTSSFEN